MRAGGGGGLAPAAGGGIEEGGGGETRATECRHGGWTLSNGGVHILTGSLTCARRPGAKQAADYREVAVVPVQYQSRALGIYTLYLDWPVSALGEDVLELLISIGRPLGWRWKRHAWTAPPASWRSWKNAT